jgi:hypothetical protein
MEWNQAPGAFFYDSYQAAQVHWGTIFQLNALYNICLIIYLCSYLVSHMVHLAQPFWLHLQLLFVTRNQLSLGSCVAWP